MFFAPTGLYLLPLLYLEGPVRWVAVYAAALHALPTALILWRAVRGVRRLDRIAQTAPEHPGPYVLLLRAFHQTAGHVDEAVYTGIDGMSVETPGSILGAVEEGLRQEGYRLVAVGGEMMLGRDHALFWLEAPDDRWEATVEALAEGAAAILMVPETSAGVRAEIALLQRRGFLQKTIWVMAPLPQEGLMVSFPKAGERGSAWEACREALAGVGLRLPEYQPRGALFRLDAADTPEGLREIGGAGGILGRVTAGGLKPAQVRALGVGLARMIGEVDAGAVSFRAVWPRLRAEFMPVRPVDLLRVPGEVSQSGLWMMSAASSVLFNAIAPFFLLMS
jgi:hypothetical protein